MSDGPDREPADRPKVVVTGSAGALGRAVAARLEDIGADVVGVDRRPAGTVDVMTDLLEADLADMFEGAASVVHLASTFGPALDGDPEVTDGGDVLLARAVLDGAAKAGVAHLVVRSSATVYGAWANNPIPLTEDAPLRPVPDLAYAVQSAEVERLVGEWRAAAPDRRAAVLRPVVTTSPEDRGWLAKGLRAAGAVTGHDDDPPQQVLALDDLASAVVEAVDGQLDGPYNVAPEGWVSASTSRALEPAPRVRVPAAVADRIASIRWRFRLARTPIGLQAYARHPWVVASDRLRAEGWTPTLSNEEALVEGTPAGPLATISPRRRQEIALGVAAAAIVGGVVGTVLLLRRRTRGA